MSRADSLFQGLGSLELPVDPAEFTDSLKALDPGLAILTALFKSAINSEFTTAWQRVTATLAAPQPLYGSLPVADTLELEPTPALMQQRKAVFPLLCVHRSGEALFDEATLTYDRLTQPWDVHYILCPLDVGDLRKLHFICVAVGKLIRLVIEKRGHPSYESGALQFFPDKGAFSSIDLVSQQGPGQAQFAGNEDGPIYYAISFKLKTTELSSNDLGAFGNFDAMDASIGVGNADSVVPDLMQVDTSIPSPDE